MPNTALVRTVQRLSVGVQDYLPPHNFIVKPVAKIHVLPDRSLRHLNQLLKLTLLSPGVNPQQAHIVAGVLGQKPLDLSQNLSFLGRRQGRAALPRPRFESARVSILQTHPVPLPQLLPHLGHGLCPQPTSGGAVAIARATVSLRVPMGRGLPPGPAGYIVRTAIAHMATGPRTSYRHP